MADDRRGVRRHATRRRPHVWSAVALYGLAALPLFFGALMAWSLVHPFSLLPLAGVVLAICGALVGLSEAVCHTRTDSVWLTDDGLSHAHGWRARRSWPWPAVTGITWGAGELVISLGDQELRLPLRMRGIVDLAQTVSDRTGMPIMQRSGRGQALCEAAEPRVVPPDLHAALADLPPSYTLLIIIAYAFGGLAGLLTFPAGVIPLQFVWTTRYSLTAGGVRVRRGWSNRTVAYRDIVDVVEWSGYQLMITRTSEYFISAQFGSGKAFIEWLNSFCRADPSSVPTHVELPISGDADIGDQTLRRQ